LALPLFDRKERLLALVSPFVRDCCDTKGLKMLNEAPKSTAITCFQTKPATVRAEERCCGIRVKIGYLPVGSLHPATEMPHKSELCLDRDTRVSCINQGVRKRSHVRMQWAETRVFGKDLPEVILDHFYSFLAFKSVKEETQDYAE
jgi:hypothetical protein